VAARMLARRGHQVVLASNGKEVLAALALHSFDLILMDVQMPEMDGFATTIAIRKSEELTGLYQPIIAMTAMAMKGDRERCLAAGMDGYLSKPIDLGELDAILQSCLDRRQHLAVMAMPSSESPAATVNKTELLQRIDGDRAFLAELVGIFREESPGLMRKAREAIVRNDAAEVERMGHALRGALVNLSAIAASGLAAELEKMSRSGELVNAAATLQQLEEELPRTLETLDSLACEVV
jgi:two-component system sensor histidine kinase/response regulator